MAPDHTLLLEEGEAYLTLDAVTSSSDVNEIIAVRSPSYFQGDLRKLKLVDQVTLWERAASLYVKKEVNNNLPEPLQRTARERCKFFETAKNVLILSMKGKTFCEAEKMSGGDHDGDKAWVCWNPSLVQHVNENEPEDTSTYVAEKSPKENIPFYEMDDENDGGTTVRCSSTTKEKMLNYLFHFRHHHAHMGTIDLALSKMVDKFGFGHKVSRLLGKAAFIQVRRRRNNQRDMTPVGAGQRNEHHPWFAGKSQTFICFPIVFGTIFFKFCIAFKVDVPYNLASLKGCEILRYLYKDWPHWLGSKKNKDQYRSTKILGQLFDYMTEKENNIRDERDKDRKPDITILNFVQKCATKRGMDDEDVDALRHEMNILLDSYKTRRSEICGGFQRIDREEYIKWRDTYVEKERKRAIMTTNDHTDVGLTEYKELIASILYEQASDIIAGNREFIDMQFAWQTSFDYLCRITSNAYHEGCHGPGFLPVPISHDMEKNLFSFPF